MKGEKKIIEKNNYKNNNRIVSVSIDKSKENKLLNRKKNKQNSFIDEEEEDESSEQEVINKTTSRRKINRKNVENTLPLNEIQNNNSERKFTNVLSNIRKKIIIDDDIENDVIYIDDPIINLENGNNSSDKVTQNNSWKKSKKEDSILKEDKNEDKKIKEIESERKAQTNAFMKMLEVKSKELEKKVEKSDDLNKLSLKERLALKASKGTIDSFFNAMQNFSASNILKSNPYSINISNDDVINDIINKGNK